MRKVSLNRAAIANSRETKSTAMSYKPINIREKLTLFSDIWAPKVIAEMNDYQFKVAKFHRKFVWHRHEDTDEAFLVINGEVRIDFRHGHVDLRPGDLFVVGRCVEHRPTSKCGADVLLIVPKGISNTGTVGGQLTAAANNWI